jgi:hypothetical protein
MFKFLRKLFKPRPAAPAQPRLTLPSHSGPVPTVPSAPKTKTAPVPPPTAKQEWAKNASRRINPSATPEEICGVTPDMTKDQISAHLAMLYRRHNRAASSLEANLREEAEIMLDVIATMRQKYLQ